MKKFIFLSAMLAVLTYCEKIQPDFNSIATDNLLFPGVNLQPSTWARLDSLTYLSLSDVSFCDENNGMISGFGGTVYITRNGGESWRTINTNAHMTFLSIYTLDERTFFSGRYGLYKSTDSGNSWRLCKLNPEISVFDIWFKDSKNGFLSSGSGTYRSEDAGETWTKINSLRAKNLQFTSDRIGYFTCGSTPISEIPGGLPLKGSGDIYRTTDGGKTWRPMGLDVAEITSLSFISDKTGFFTTNDRLLYKTTDGGESCVLAGETDFYTSDIFFVNESQGILCASSGIFITLDGGLTFRSEYIHMADGSVYNMEFPTPRSGFAIGNKGYILKRIPKNQQHK